LACASTCTICDVLASKSFASTLHKADLSDDDGSGETHSYFENHMASNEADTSF
jgi:hypothetical protein